MLRLHEDSATLSIKNDTWCLFFINSLWSQLNMSKQKTFRWLQRLENYGNALTQLNTAVALYERLSPYTAVKFFNRVKFENRTAV